MSGSVFASWFAGAVPADLGVKDGRLRPCPDKPNCVCSQASDAHHVQPLAFEGSADSALSRLKAIVAAMPRMRIVHEAPHYLRAESESRLFGFVDDLELLVAPDAHVVHVRSASRLGRSDFGVNRKRVEAIRASFARLDALK